MEEGKRHNLTILLLKEIYDTPKDYLDSDGRPPGEVIVDEGDEIGTIFIKRPQAKRPAWASFFEEVFDIKKFGNTKHILAVFIVRAADRFFALTFGHGRHLLKPGCYEERFGLKTVLNSVGKKNIRALNKKTFDSIDRQSIEQASKESSIDEFGLDIEQDLLRGVDGVPKDPRLGTNMSGKEALSISTRVKISDVKSLLEELYNKYMDDSYKEEFPWVDYIQAIKNKDLIHKLDREMVLNLSSEPDEKMWMTIPDIINWGKVHGFCYGRPATAEKKHNVCIEDFINTLSEEEAEHISIEQLKNKQIYCVDYDGQTLHRWPIYRCIYCEVTIDGYMYLFSDGNWYAVDNDFIENVQQAYNNASSSLRVELV
ncbi:MAG: TIGR04141 family sporadically distributed protein [Desulfarculus sp.]|nr:TIGR04141 family sporadically distributed protein [Pseudomonadota bacterium]MBU4596568.1 TIGR04141 family sporadically distributed protein [Pseudomonadota bacterium]MBV1716535.1 TIGR04141 family sporadically distributed protein [Desulfarculus sp.]MBV1737181.1 TIGR04141 family sporadically distributed protein [Desulfarculus sp.]